MYGSKQAAKLTRDQLIAHLQKAGYSPTTQAQKNWAHTTRKTKFCLCVDGFGIKCYNNSDTDHLLSALREAYSITVDKSGKKSVAYNLNCTTKKDM